MIGKSDFRKKIGTAPGTLIYTGEENKRSIELSVLRYNNEELEETRHTSVDTSFFDVKENYVNWFDLDGIHETQSIESVGKLFKLHPLVLEDIANIDNRPKIEEHENFLFFSAIMLNVTDKNEINKEQISMILGDNFVLSFQQYPGDVFGDVRNRIRKSIGRIRNSGSDYLVYALLDTIVDHYYFVEEMIQLKIDEIETAIYNQQYSDKGFMLKIQQLRKEIIELRKAVTPLKESVINLKKSGNPKVSKSTTKFLGDLLDHIHHIHDSAEVFRESINSLTDLYHSFQSSKLNEVMKVLTVISTIFIPLSFLTGLYGMNFQNMPELDFKYGYFVLLCIMLILFIGMIYYFKRKNWI